MVCARLRARRGFYTIGRDATPARRPAVRYRAAAAVRAVRARRAGVEPLSGEGTYGEADDKVVTNAGFIIIIAFPLFILCMSLLQQRAGQAQGTAQAGGQEAERRRTRPTGSRLVEPAGVP